MSVESLALVLHHSKAKGADKLILVGIANHDGDGGAWPSVATLARYANLEERSVQRALRRLVDLGELAIHVQAGGPSGIAPWRRPNRYEVLIACPVTCDHSSRHRPRALPQSPADLWIKGVTPTSPGDAHVTGGVTPTSPGGVTPTSPEPYKEPSNNPGVEIGSQLKTARVVCSICSRLEDDCRSRTHVSGHEFHPKASRRTA